MRRLLALVPVLPGVVGLAFLLTRLLPGDPAVFLADNPAADAATVAALRARLGLDQPLWRQFLDYLGQLARGDLGVSLSTGRPVLEELLARLPASAELVLAGFCLAVAAAVPLGVLAALRPGGVADGLCRVVGTLGLALPAFVSGLLLAGVFYLHLGWAPEPVGRLDPFALPPPVVSGFMTLDTLLAGDVSGWRDSVAHLALPAATVALFSFAPLARATRGAMLGVLGRDFIRAARAHRLSARRVVLSYALRNAALPVLTTMGMVFSGLLGANVLVERVFAWPGLGSFAMDALLQLDFAAVQGFVLLMAGLFLLVNLVVDLVCAWVDPRAGLLPDA